MKDATYRDVEKDLSGLEGKLEALGTDRPIGELEALISGILARPIASGARVRGTVGGLSSNCTKANVRTGEACIEVAQLRIEHTLAAEAKRLGERATDLRKRITLLRESGGAIAPDPLGEFYARATRGLVTE